MSRRRLSDDNPFEDYYDYIGGLAMGSADAIRPHPWEVLEKEANEWAEEIAEREAKRIPPGFQLP